MARGRRQRWEGGFIRRTKSGRKVYVIERWLNGKAVKVSTGCSTLEGAKEELARWEKNPTAYRPGAAAAGAVILDADLVARYKEYQRAKGETEEWIAEVARCLADWIKVLWGKDLRALDLHADLLAPLNDAKKWPRRRRQRINAIKGLFRYLREVDGRVKRQTDATIDLKVPQASPEKLRRRKVFTPEYVADILRRLPPRTRDLLLFLSATSWHITEAARFRAEGEIAKPENDEGILAVLIVAQRKSGRLTKTPLKYPEHLDVAERIKAWPDFPTRMTISRHMRAALAQIHDEQRDAKVPEDQLAPKFNLGWMRHNVLTWSVKGRTIKERAQAARDAAAFADHQSQRTTNSFYLDLDIPTAPIHVERLEQLQVIDGGKKTA